MPTLPGFALDMIEFPEDPVPRNAAIDWLLDHDDPRAELLRLVPRLLQTPRREGVRPDVTVDVWQGPRRSGGGNVTWRDSQADWPVLCLPRVPGRPPTGPRWPYRGCNGLGRLLGIAFVHDALAASREMDQSPAQQWTTILPWLVEFELYACGLLSRAPSPREPLDGNRFLLSRAALWCRTGRFGRFIQAAQDLDFVPYQLTPWLPSDAPWPDRLRQFLACKAVGYSRRLDLLDTFITIAPWQAAFQSTALRRPAYVHPHS